MKKTAKTYRFNDETILKLQELDKLETEKKERGMWYRNSTQVVEEAISKYYELVFSKEEAEADERRLLKKMCNDISINQEALWTILKLLNRLKFIERPKSDVELKKFISDIESIYKKPIDDKVSKKMNKKNPK